MKTLLRATLLVCIATSSIHAQRPEPTTDPEDTVRGLEQAENDAVVRGDVAALEKLWAEDFTVNNPNNQISTGRKDVLDRVRAGLISYASYVREIESVKVYGDTVIVMGLEIVTPVGKSPGAGRTLRRRYTNIWMAREGTWRLAARHANVICQN